MFLFKPFCYWLVLHPVFPVTRFNHVKPLQLIHLDRVNALLAFYNFTLLMESHMKEILPNGAN